MEDDNLSLAYNLSYDAWVIDLRSTTTLPLAFSRSTAPAQFGARENGRRRHDKSSPSLGFSRPLLARLWETTRSWIDGCKWCRMRESMSKIAEQPQRRSTVWFYSQMGHQLDHDEKVEAAILYCKKTLQMDGAASSSPDGACLISHAIKMQQH